LTLCSSPRALVIGLAAAALLSLTATRAHAEAQLLIEASTGKVLHAENATYPWYPASVTKLMTAYTTLRAVRDGKVSFNTLLTMSKNAAAQQPTKMGFKIGTTVTVDNALKMLMRTWRPRNISSRTISKKRRWRNCKLRWSPIRRTPARFNFVV